MGDSKSKSGMVLICSHLVFVFSWVRHVKSTSLLGGPVSSWLGV